MLVLLRNQRILLYLKTRIKVFFLDLNVKARIIEHAFLGRFRDESQTTAQQQNEYTSI